MIRILRRFPILAATVAAGVFLWGGTAYPGEKLLNGAGATFPEPFYYKILDVYHRQSGTNVLYRGVGSGTGMQELMTKKVDFAGTDISRGDQPDDGSLLRVPTCLGAVAVIYNLPDNPKLRFTGDILADIFLGKISRWNDPRLVAINGDMALPDLAITVIQRSDESGTSFIFTDYLSKASREWQKNMGAGKPSFERASGLGAKGNPALTGMVRQIPGAIGYVELTYAVANGMTFGSVRNRAGKFVDPSPATAISAAKGMATHDNGISLTDTGAPEGYPIVGFSWLVIFREQKYEARTRERAEDLVKMLWWVTHEGQKFAPALRYVPLPRELVRKTESILRTVTYGGAPVQKKR